MKILVDTCVIIDALQCRKPFNREAEEIILFVANRQIDGFITAKAVTDIYYLTHRNTHSGTEARKILANLFSLFGVLDTHGSDCRSALISPMVDYEDAVMAETGLRSGMDCIITRNIKDYACAPLPVFTPREFLQRLKKGFEDTSTT